jgi:hypothetical protein
MSDRIAELLLNLAKKGVIDPKEFRLFIYGGVVNQLPLAVLEGVVDLLLGIDDQIAPDAALDLLDSRLRGHPDEGALLARRIEQTLGAAAFVEGKEQQAVNNMLLYRWNEVANRLLELDVDAAANLAVRLIEHFASRNSVTAGFHPEPFEFLSNAAKSKPDVVWHAVAHRLESPKDLGTWHLLNWLGGGRSIRGDELAGLDALPSAMVFEWIDVAPADRAWILAEHCPPVITNPNEPPSFARQLLERYALIEQVRRSLHANSFSESWSGPASEHYRGKLAGVDELLSRESNTNVRLWLKERRERLVASIERELEQELRDREY